MFPEFFRNRPHWLVHRLEDKQSLSPLPRCPEALADDLAWRTRWNRPEVHADYKTAKRAVDRFPDKYGLTHVVHHFWIDPEPTTRLICLDFDGAINAKGTVDSEVATILTRFGTFAERSKSRRGIHGFLLVDGCPAFGNCIGRPVGGCKVDVLCANAVNVTGDIIGDYSELAAISFDELGALPFFEFKAPGTRPTSSGGGGGGGTAQPPARSANDILSDMTDGDHERGKELVESFPPAIEGQGGQSKFFAMAARLREYGFDQDAIWALMVTYAKADPPFTDEEVAHIVNGACDDVELQGEVGSKTPGAEFKDETGVDLPTNAKPDNQDARMESLKANLGRSVAELDHEAPPVDPLIFCDLLSVRDVVNVTASSKTGKSYFTCQLVVTYANGLEWFGYKPGDAGRKVWVCDLELKARSLVNRYRRMIAAIEGASDENIFLDSFKANPININEFAELAREMKRRHDDLAIIVLDSAYALVGWEESDPKMAATNYRKLTRLAQELGVCLVMVQHTTKGDQSEKAVIDMTSGTGVHGRAIELQVAVRPSSEPDVVLLDMVAREHKSPETMALRRTFPVWTVAADLDAKKLKKKSGNGRVYQDVTFDRVVDAFVSLSTAAKVGVDGFEVNHKTLANCIQRTNSDVSGRGVSAALSEFMDTGYLERIDRGKTYHLTLTQKGLDECNLDETRETRF